MGRTVTRIVTVVLFLAVAVLYYYFHGPGPTPSERAMELPWWRPLGLAQSLDWSLLGPFQEISSDYDEARHQGEWEPRGLIPFALFGLPPLLLTVLGFRVFRSAVARVFLLGGLLTLLAFVYYGWLDLGTWEDYAWRWPIALGVTATCISAFALAPALVEVLRPRSRWVHGLAFLALFVPVYFLTTEVTGTNPELEWNLSPWPVITLYGFLLFGLVFGVVHFATGIGLLAGGFVPGAAGIALAVGVAAALAVLLHGIPFAVTDVLRILVLALPAALLAGWEALRAPEPGARRAAAFVVAGLAIVGCVKVSQWQAEFFQAEAREEISPRVIAALDQHKLERGSYPLELEDLVPDYLAEVPNPRVGWLGEKGEAFMYVDLGDSYLLEFSNAMWVECHYSPAYHDEEEGEELEASWSCEPRPPRLW
jgi:hypothetical protein